MKRPLCDRGLALALVLTIGGAPCASAVAAPAEDFAEAFPQAFAEANALSGTGDYDAAIARYRELAAALPQADVYFNLGTTEALAGHLGPAVWALEQALILEPGHEDAQINLDLVRQQALRVGLSSGGDLRVILPGDDDVGTGLLTALTPRTVTLGFGACWTLMFGLLAARRLNRRRGDEETHQTVVMLGVVTAALGAMAFGGLLLGRVLVVREADYGIVVAERGLVQAGPGDQYRPVARVMAGVKLRLRGEEAAWMNVILPDGGSGWVKTTDVARLKGT